MFNNNGLVIKGNRVAITVGDQIYEDTRDHFISDLGFSFPKHIQDITYWIEDKECWINGNPNQIFPNAFAEKILSSFDMLFDKQQDRLMHDFRKEQQANFEKLSTEQKALVISKKVSETIQAILDQQAREKNYPSCLEACSYIATGNERFDKDGEQFRRWRSQVWESSPKVIQAAIGDLKVPALDEIREMLPKFEEESRTA